MILPEKEITCPYCGERISIVIDDSVDEQYYIEDCSVCCQPINVRVMLDIEGSIAVSVTRDDE